MKTKNAKPLTKRQQLQRQIKRLEAECTISFGKALAAKQGTVKHLQGVLARTQ